MTAEQDAEMIQNSLLKEAEDEGKKLGINESKIEIAKSMLKEKIDINTISNCTNLSIDEINILK